MQEMNSGLAARGNTPDPTEDLEDFVYRPAPQGITIKCRITRDKKVTRVLVSSEFMSSLDSIGWLQYFKVPNKTPERFSRVCFDLTNQASFKRGKYGNKHFP